MISRLLVFNHGLFDLSSYAFLGLEAAESYIILISSKNTNYLYFGRLIKYFAVVLENFFYIRNGSSDLC